MCCMHMRARGFCRDAGCPLSRPAESQFSLFGLKKNRSGYCLPRFANHARRVDDQHPTILARHGLTLAPARSQRRRGHLRHVQEGKWDRRSDVTIRHICINQKGKILVGVQLDKTGNGDMRPIGVALRGRADPLHPGPLTRVGYATCLRGFAVKSTKNVTNRHIDGIRGTTHTCRVHVCMYVHVHYMYIHTYTCMYITDGIVKPAKWNRMEKSLASSVSPQTGMDFPVVQL